MSRSNQDRLLASINSCASHLISQSHQFPPPTSPSMSLLGGPNLVKGPGCAQTLPCFSDHRASFLLSSPHYQAITGISVSSCPSPSLPPAQAEVSEGWVGVRSAMAEADWPCVGRDWVARSLLGGGPAVVVVSNGSTMPSLHLSLLLNLCRGPAGTKTSDVSCCTVMSGSVRHWPPCWTHHTSPRKGWRGERGEGRQASLPWKQTNLGGS